MHPGARMIAVGLLTFVSLAFTLPKLGSAALDTPQILSYQARLTDAQKVTVPDGARLMSFLIYDAAIGGSCVYAANGTCGTPGTTSITVTDGLFNVLIGDTGAGMNALPDNLFNTTSERWLEVRISGETLTPRRRIVSSATALQAGNASLLDAFDSSQTGGVVAFVPVTDSSGNLVLSANLTVDTDTLTLDSTTDSVAIGGPVVGEFSVYNSAGARMIVVDTAFGFTVIGDADSISTGAGVYVDVPGDTIFLNATTVSAPATLDANIITAVTAVQTGDGSAVLPGFGFTGDTNTGIFRPGTDILAFTTGSTERARINATGDVGIGDSATAPTAQLHVIQADATNSFRVDDQASDTTPFVIDQSGSVGIGTATPIEQFHVTGVVPSAATGSAATGTGPQGVFVQDRRAYVVNGTANTLQIFDISTPTAPVSLGTVATDAAPRGPYVQGHYAYVANTDGNTLQIFDVANSASPVAVGSVATGADPDYVYVQGRYAYVVRTSALEIIDVSNPASPVSVGTVATGTNPRSVYVQGKYAYVINIVTPVLGIFDVSNPTAPVSVGSVSVGALPFRVVVQGQHAYVVRSAALEIIDVSNPASPVNVGTLATGVNSRGLYVQGRYAYITNTTTGNLQIIDVSNPASPVSVGTTTTGAGPNSVYVQGRFAYVVNSTAATLQVFDVGGAYIQQFEAGGIESGTLATRSNAQIGNDLDVRGGLHVARGAEITGPLSVYGGASNALFVVDQTGNVAIGSSAPTSALDLNGAFTVRGMVAPGLSPSGQGRIYFDSTSNTFKVSQHAGAYFDLATAGTAFVQNGNSFGATATLGTNDANHLDFETNGLFRARLDSSGNILQGATVVSGVHAGFVLSGDDFFTTGDIAAQDNMYADSFTAGDSSTVYGQSSASSTTAFSLLSTGSLTFNAQTSGGADDIIFTTAGSEKMRLLENGNFGINDTTPAERLDVSGNIRAQTISPYLKLVSDTWADSSFFQNNVTTTGSAGGDYTGIITPSGKGFYVGQGLTAPFVIDLTGNVGIGTSTPNSLLQVDRDQDGTTRVTVSNANTGTSALAGYRATNDIVGSAGLFGLAGSGYTAVPGLANRAFLDTVSASDGIILNNEGADPILFSTNNSERMRVDAAGNVGIGTTGPTERFQVVAGTLAADRNAVKVTGTLATTPTASNNAVFFDVTSNGSSAVANQDALNVLLRTGYTGSASTHAMYAENDVAGGTGALDPSAFTSAASANYALETFVGGAGSGSKVGIRGLIRDSTSFNTGVLGAVDVTGSGATNFGVVGNVLAPTVGASKNIGVAGFATNGSIQVGGYFALTNTTPTYTNSALLADNGAVAAPIFIARDNGTAVFTIADGGDSTLAPVSGHTGDAFKITAGTLADGMQALDVTATLPTTPTGVATGSLYSITTAGSNAQARYGMEVDLNAGYTGSHETVAVIGLNQVAGTGTFEPIAANTALYANTGAYGWSGAAGAGTRIGTYGLARLGSGILIGSYGDVDNPAAGATAYGTLGSATNTGSGSTSNTRIGASGFALNGTTNVGGFFGLMSSPPTYASAALMADNGATTSNIFVARDNGTAVFTIADGGGVTMTGNLLPSADDTYDLGSTTARWANAYIGPGSLHIGSNGDDSTLSYSTGSDLLTFQNSVDSANGFQFLDADGGTPIMNIDTTNEFVGIGDTSPNAKFDVEGVSGGARYLYVGPDETSFSATTQSDLFATIPSNIFTGLDVPGDGAGPLNSIHEISGARVGAATAMQGAITTTNPTLTTVDNAIGIGGITYHTGAGTVTNSTGAVGSAYSGGSGAMTDASGVRGGIFLLSTGNITRGAALWGQTNSDTGAGTITNNYGLFLESQNGVGTNNYQIFSDTATNKFVVRGDGFVGVGDITPDAFFDIDSIQTTGTISGMSFGTATTLTGTLTGLSLNLVTNLTADDQSITGQTISLPTQTFTAVSRTVRGLTMSGGTLTTATSGVVTADMLNITNEDITQGAGTTLSTAGVHVTTRSITTGGTQRGFQVSVGSAPAAGTHIAYDADSFTPGGATDIALRIGSGWDRDVQFVDDSPTFVFADGARMSWTDGTNELALFADLSTNFGLAVDAGAFMSRNSAVADEFNIERSDLTADTAGAGGNGFGDAQAWGVYESTATGCTFSTLNDAVNGILEIDPGATTAGCLAMLDAAANDPHSILDANNLPVLLMKMKPTTIGADNVVYAGMADDTDGTTAAPNDFIGFSNDDGTPDGNWYGVARSGGTQSTTASCGAASTTQFALMKVEVRSATDVHFFIDTDVSNGVSWSECGTGLTTNIPTTALAPQLHYQSRATTAGVLDVDFFRAWQDDSKDAPANYVSKYQKKSDTEGRVALAQLVPAKNLEIPSGTLVSMDPLANVMGAEPSKVSYDPYLLGVVVKDAAIVLGNGTFDGVKVATSGRVSVKVSNQNGMVKKGDWLTSSDIPGVAVKAAAQGTILGYALQDATNAFDTVMVQLQIQAGLPVNTASAATAATTSELRVYGDLDFAGYAINNIRAINSANWSISAEGALVAKKVTTDELVINTAGAAQTIGSGSVAANELQVTINNPSVHASSKIFLSWRGVPGWIADQGEGYFTVRLLNASPQPTNFDYWIVQVIGGTSSAPAPAPLPPPPPPAEITTPTEPATTTTPTEPATTTELTAPAEVIAPSDPVVITPLPVVIPATEPESSGGDSGSPIESGMTTEPVPPSEPPPADPVPPAPDPVPDPEPIPPTP